MSAIRVVYAIARADFLERVRRYSYLVTLLFAVYLGYAAGTGKISLRLGDYRGLYTSAWIGAMVSLVATTFLSLVGFYIVKNAVDRDRQSRVGEILAGTPLTKVSYLLGKFLSNFAVLASMVAVLALAAVAMQFLAAEDRAFRIGPLLLPFLFLTVPAIAMTAAVALLFDASRVLRGGVGNVLWFFLWTFGIALPGLTGAPQFDPSGLWTVFQSMVPAARAGIPGYVDSFSLTVADKSVRVATGFHWNGVEWTLGVLGWRLAWTVVAFAVVLCGAWFFDRFDPARSRWKSGVKPRQEGASAHTGEAPEITVARGHSATPTRLSPLPAGSRRSGFVRLLMAELRLALKGYRWWWYAVAGDYSLPNSPRPWQSRAGRYWRSRGFGPSSYGPRSVHASSFWHRATAFFLCADFAAAASGGMDGRYLGGRAHRTRSCRTVGAGRAACRPLGLGRGRHVRSVIGVGAGRLERYQQVLRRPVHGIVVRRSDEPGPSSRLYRWRQRSECWPRCGSVFGRRRDPGRSRVLSPGRPTARNLSNTGHGGVSV